MRNGGAGLCSRFIAHRGGHFALMTAITAPIAITLAAIAVDSGSLYVEKRRAQSLADLSAITAAANLDKPTIAVLTTLSENGVNAVMAPAQPSAATMMQEADRVTVLTGHYHNDASILPENRFAAGSLPVNAVMVTYRTIGTRYFAGSLIPPPEISATGIATSSSAAAFSIGSRLLEVNGGYLNAILGGLTGSNISLSVMDYEALVGADVSLLSFLDELAVELDLTAGSYTKALDTQVTVGQISRALSRSQGPNSNAQSAARKLAAQAGSRKLRLSELIDLGDEPIAQATIRQIAAEMNVMELLALSTVVAGRGKHVSLSLPANIPGILSASVELAVGEPPQNTPWLRIGNGGELVRTAQTRLAVTLTIGGVGGLLGDLIRIPLYLEVAYGEARLKSITCPSGRLDSRKVAIEARPGIANLYLAEVNTAKIGNFASPLPRLPANLINLAVVKVTGQAQAEISNVTFKTLTFTHNDIVGGNVKSVVTQNYGESLIRSLLSSVQLSARVELGPLGIPLITLPSNSLALVADKLGNAVKPIDEVLYTLLSALGVSLGKAEIRVNGATCGRAVLVQ